MDMFKLITFFIKFYNFKKHFKKIKCLIEFFLLEKIPNNPLPQYSIVCALSTETEKLILLFSISTYHYAFKKFIKFGYV